MREVSGQRIERRLPAARRAHALLERGGDQPVPPIGIMAPATAGRDLLCSLVADRPGGHGHRPLPGFHGGHASSTAATASWRAAGSSMARTTRAGLPTATTFAGRF